MNHVNIKFGAQAAQWRCSLETNTLLAKVLNITEQKMNHLLFAFLLQTDSKLG